MGSECNHASGRDEGCLAQGDQEREGRVGAESRADGGDREGLERDFRIVFKLTKAITGAQVITRSLWES